MLKSNRSASSLTPIETNTDAEYGLGYYDYDVPKMSDTPTNTRTSIGEGQNTVQIRVIDSDRNETEKNVFYDEDKDDDNDVCEEAVGGNDENGNNDPTKWNSMEKWEKEDGKIDLGISTFLEDAKSGSQDVGKERDKRTSTPSEQHTERLCDDNDETHDVEHNGEWPSQEANSQEDGDVIVGNTGGKLYSKHKQNRIQYHDNKNAQLEERIDVMNSSQIIQKVSSNHMENIETSSLSNFPTNSNSPHQLHKLSKETVNDAHGDVSETNETQESSPREVGFSDNDQPPDRLTQSHLNVSAQSGAIFMDDFFDRKDSVELSYFASFNDTGLSNAKSMDKTAIAADEQNDKFQNDEGASIPHDNDLNTGDETGKTSEHKSPLSNIVTHNSEDEPPCNTSKSNLDTKLGSGELASDTIKSENSDENNLQAEANVLGKPPTDLNDGDCTANDTPELTDDRSKPTVSSTEEIIVSEASSPKDDTSHTSNCKAGSDEKDDSDNSNSGDDDIDRDSDDQIRSPDIEEIYSLTEPDEQSIMRVYISKNEEEQPESDGTSQTLQYTDGAYNNIVNIYRPLQRNKNKGKLNTKSSKRDKKNKQASPYTNSGFKYDTDSRAIERLKQGPYAEVFKRDVPKVPAKSKNGQENFKKSKSNDKSKPQSSKKDNKVSATHRSPSKHQVKGKTINLKKVASRDHVTEFAVENNSQQCFEDESIKAIIDVEPNEISFTPDKKIDFKQTYPQESDNDDDNKSVDDTAGNDDLPEKQMDIEMKTLHQSVPQPNVTDTMDEMQQNLHDLSNNEKQIETSSGERCLETTTNGSTTNETSETKVENLSEKETAFGHVQPEENINASVEAEHQDVINDTRENSHSPPPDRKTPIADTTNSTDININDQEPKAPTESESNTIGQESDDIVGTEFKPENDSKSFPKKESIVNVNKNTKGNNDKVKQTALMGSSAKKKIIISSPKTTAKMAAKSKQMSEKAKNTKKSQSLKANQNSDQKTKERKISDTKTLTNDSKSQLEIVEPATITVIDETSELDEKVNGRAGRLIINNIKNKLRKNSIKRHTSNSSVASVQLITNSRPSSPDDKGLNASIPHQGARPAYKTQSMSSLQVPGHLSTSNPWDPTREEDAVSIGSRRPSMDSVSRKSVDYRISNTTMVIQPHNDEKPKSVFTSDETYIQNAVPCLPMSLAVFCLILNIIMPGSGTIISGLSVLCCGHSRLSNKEDQMLNSLCANLFVGIAQLFTVSFMLVGWFWSISWGVKMVSVSARHRQELRQQREKDLQAMALSAFGSPKRMNLFSA